MGNLRISGPLFATSICVRPQNYTNPHLKGRVRLGNNGQRRKVGAFRFYQRRERNTRKLRRKYEPRRGSYCFGVRISKFPDFRYSFFATLRFFRHFAISDAFGPPKAHSFGGDLRISGPFLKTEFRLTQSDVARKGPKMRTPQSKSAHLVARKWPESQGRGPSILSTTQEKWEEFALEVRDAHK